MNNFLEYHKSKPIPIQLPNGEKIDVFITNKAVMDEYSNEYYLNIEIRDRQKYNKLTNKIIEHYSYYQLKEYLKLFSIDGDIYIKFNYL